jgi:hypothetical protein
MSEKFITQAATDVVQSEVLRYSAVIAAVVEYANAVQSSVLPGSSGDIATLFTSAAGSISGFFQNTLTWANVVSIANDTNYYAADLYTYDLEEGSPISFNLNLFNVQEGASSGSSHGFWVVPISKRDPLYQAAYLYGWNRTSLWQEADHAMESFRASTSWQQARAWMTLASDLERLGAHTVTANHVSDLAGDLGGAVFMASLWSGVIANLAMLPYSLLPSLSSSTAVWTAIQSYVNARYQQRVLNFLSQFPTPLAQGFPYDGGYFGWGPSAGPSEQKIWY